MYLKKLLPSFWVKTHHTILKHRLHYRTQFTMALSNNNILNYFISNQLEFKIFKGITLPLKIMFYS